jgi:hypothetical protein
MTKEPDRTIPLVLAFVAAAALLYACFAPAWLYNPRNKDLHEVGFNLMSTFECNTERECRSMSNSALVAEWRKELEDIRRRAKEDPTDPQVQAFAAKAADEYRASGAFPAFGLITLGCLALAALSLLVCAAIVLAKKRIAWPIMPTTTAVLGVMIGLVTGCVFAALKPGPPGYVGVHLGFYAFGGGCIAGIAAALMLNKLMRPHDPDLLADSMDPDQY